MKKLLTAVIVLALMQFISCKKPDDANPTNNNPYYFKFTMAGSNVNLTSAIPQYMFLYEDVAGGYLMPSLVTLYPTMGLSFQWKNVDTVKQANVMSLKGKTIRFDDPNIKVKLDYEPDDVTELYSIDTASANYAVTISDVSFLKNDTAVGYYLKTYVVTGTCNAMLQNATGSFPLTNGSFHFIISHRDY